MSKRNNTIHVTRTWVDERESPEAKSKCCEEAE